MKGYPKWLNGSFIKLFYLSLILSGALLIPTLLEFKLEISVPWRLKTPTRDVVAYIHYILGTCSLILIGSLWSIHMRREWRRKEKRFSGTILALLHIFLFITSSGILYLGNEEYSNIASTLHFIFSLLFIMIILIHFFFSGKLSLFQKSSK